MIESFILFIQVHLLPLGSLGVLAAAFLEEIIAPIPSALVMLGAGFLFISGPVDFHNLFRLVTIVVIPASIGVTAGSLLVYGIAFYAGKPILQKWGKWFGLSWTDIEKLQAKFATTSFNEWALVTARAIPIIPSVAISAFSGVIRFSFWPYILCTLAGTIVRTFVLGFVGWRVGQVYFKYAAIVSSFEKIIFAAIIVCVVGFIGWGLYRSRRIP